MSWIKTDQPRQPPLDPLTVVCPDANTFKTSAPSNTTAGHNTIPPHQTTPSPNVSVSVTLSKHLQQPPIQHPMQLHTAAIAPPMTQATITTSQGSKIVHHSELNHAAYSAIEFPPSAVTVPSSWRAPLLNAGHWAVLPATIDATASQPQHLTLAVFQSAGQVQLFLQQQRDAALQAILQLKPQRGDSTLWQWQAISSVDIPALLRQLMVLTASSAPQQPWLRSWLRYCSQAAPRSPTASFSPSSSATAPTHMAPQQHTAHDVAMPSDAGDENASTNLHQRSEAPRRQQTAEHRPPTLGTNGAVAPDNPRPRGENAGHAFVDASPLQRLAQQIHTALQQRWQQTTSQVEQLSQTKFSKDTSWPTRAALSATVAAKAAQSTKPNAMTDDSSQSTPIDVATSATMNANSSQHLRELNIKRLSRADLQPYWQFLANTVARQEPSSLQHSATELLLLLQSQQDQALKSPLALLLLGANRSSSARPATVPSMAGLSQDTAQQATAMTSPVSGQPLQPVASGLATTVFADHLQTDPAIEHLISTTAQAQLHARSPSEQGTTIHRQQLLDFIKQQLLESMRFQPLQPPDVSLNTGAAVLAGNIGMMLRMLLGRAAPSAVASTTTAPTISNAQSKLPSSPQLPSSSNLPPVGFDSQSLKDKLAAMDKLELSAVLRQVAKLSGAIQIGQLNHAEHAIHSADQKIAPTSWHITLPLAVAPEPCSVSISIQEQLAQQAQQPVPRRWQLKLNFDLASQGQMLALLTLQDLELDLQIYCDSIALRQQVLTLLPILSARLHQQGLWLQDLQCHLGKIPSVQFPKPATSCDTKA